LKAVTKARSAAEGADYDCRTGEAEVARLHERHPVHAAVAIAHSKQNAGLVDRAVQVMRAEASIRLRRTGCAEKSLKVF